MANPICIDISHWQPDPIDFAKLKANGTLGVIFKATEGTSYVDPTLRSRASAAKAAGLCISTYHFLRPGNYEAQMKHYLKTVNPVQGERMCLDHEDKGVSLASLKDCVALLLDDYRQLQVTIYSGHLIEEQLAGKRDEYLADNTSLWTAEYNNNPAPKWNTATWPAWSLWQYSQTEKVIGINGNIDGNRWNGTPEAFVKWMTPVGETAPVTPEEPAPENPQVLVAVTAPVGVDVVVTVNGLPLE